MPADADNPGELGPICALFRDTCSGYAHVFTLIFAHALVHVLGAQRRLAASHADFLTRIADWTHEKQRREEEYEDYRVAQAEAVPMTIHEMVQVDPGNFYQRQQEFLGKFMMSLRSSLSLRSTQAIWSLLAMYRPSSDRLRVMIDGAAMKLEARKAEEVQRAVAEVTSLSPHCRHVCRWKLTPLSNTHLHLTCASLAPHLHLTCCRMLHQVKNAPAINVRSAALAAETRGPESANHAEALLAWGKQASERKARKRQELEAKLQPPPSPAINANSKRLAAKWEKSQEERRRKKKLLAEEEASAKVTFKPTINKRSKEWRPSSAPSGGRHSRLNVSAGKFMNTLGLDSL